MWTGLFLIEQYSYYQTLFGAATGQTLVNAYSMIFTFYGLPVSIGYGKRVACIHTHPNLCLAFTRCSLPSLSQKTQLAGMFIAELIPPWATILMWDITSLLFVFFTVIQTRSAQYASMLFLTTLANLFYILAPLFVMFYAPPPLFGTLFGLLQASIGLLQILLVDVEDEVFDALMPDESQAALRVTGKLSLWTALLIVVAILNQIVWRSKPPPALGTVTMEVVYSARREREMEESNIGDYVRP